MEHTIVETVPLVICDRSNKRKAKKRKKSMSNSNPEDISLQKKSRFDGGLSQSPLTDHSINVTSQNMEMAPSTICDRTKEPKAKKRKKRKKSNKNNDSIIMVQSDVNSKLSNVKSPLTDHSINVMSPNMEMALSTICDRSKEPKAKKRKKRKKSNKINDSIIMVQSDVNSELSNVKSPLTDHSINVMSQNMEMALSTICDRSKEPKAKKRKKRKKSNKNNDSIIMVQSHVNSELSNVKLPSLVLKAAGQSRRKLLILDLNGLLADIRSEPVKGYYPNKCMAGKAVYKRPFCHDFLNFCFATFDVGVWSSRKRSSMECITKFLMKDRRERLMCCLDQAQCTKTRYQTIECKAKPIFLKELQKLWDKHFGRRCKWRDGFYNESNTLLIDDSPYKALRNPPYTGIFPNSYEYNNFEDNSLGPKGELRLYLKRLAAAENVQEFVKENPIGQSPITNAHPSWDFYSKVLDSSLKIGGQRKANKLVPKNMEQQKGGLKAMPQAKEMKPVLVATPKIQLENLLESAKEEALA